MYAFISEKPYIEYHAGRQVRKVSPGLCHSVVEATLGGILRRLAGHVGLVLTECHFDMSIQLGERTILVPDLAFIRQERLFGLSATYLQVPAFAPDVAVEIRSPSDRPGEREWKIATYLRAGTSLVLDVDPEPRSITAIANDSRRTFDQDDTFEHEAEPWLRFPVSEAFADLDLA